MGEGQRARETQNPKQVPGSELSAQSLTQGSNPRTMRLDKDVLKTDPEWFIQPSLVKDAFQVGE